MSMRRFPDSHPPTPRHAKMGILLVNLGSPDDTSVKALRRYLREFLSDRRVIELPRLWWWVILNGIVLRRRPPRSAAAYARIWLAGADGADGADGAPLRKYTQGKPNNCAKCYARTGMIRQISWWIGRCVMASPLSLNG